MAEKVSRRLVIDASVARSAGGEDATYPASVHCRNFLQAVLDICHRVVMTPDIREEWNKHQSRFARTWLRTMVAKKKLSILSDIEVDDELWKQIEDATESDKQRQAMIKDIRLIEAALATDKTVISLDDKIREIFDKTAEQVDKLTDIVWVNPIQTDAQPLLWLEKGAEPEKERKLGFRSGEV